LAERAGTGSMQYVDYFESHNSGMAQLDADANRNEVVSVRTLDGFSLLACHLIKIDVEGLERSVLKGSSETIRRCRPIIYAENNRPEQSGALLELLAELSYRVYRHLAPSYNPDNHFRNPHCAFKEYLESNILCIPGERDLSFPTEAALSEL
jgi:hypothetical protein